MKRIILSIVLILMLGCGVVKEQPSWSTIGSKTIVTEIVRDTVDTPGLAHMCKKHRLHPSMDEWTIMKYYNTVDDYLNQYVYTCGDTTYVISNHTDGQYIFVMRVNKPIE